ncbi:MULTISPECIES: CRISPR-associated primase-polymerase type A1 [Desulfococcus]|uniref:DNA primase small subunit n=1 Tax=Desulfococcus multivorans DSM 2059 TaxID=1121405 RepID=S7TKT8_DESML|nr:CRISPR-associated primase-polymerase type A1 [Desulfococcus multivorans]AOY59377.1 putative DNA primase, small subunit [Desulfococcus multivorans]AQV03038.2 hypothetical protein B2D07_13030 [Desulfococcus multivorans]EPR37812.1 DNA primase small subunit [Desulfococcus multivorans DSM 2059]SJZ99547.1 hypothetical protein SAMN02745446_02335 [Desulfococcus multivorans DSM 2059]
MNLPDLKKQSSDAADFRLMLASVEKRLLAGELTESDRSFLARSDIRRHLNPTQKVRWAALAQMAGEVETALSILAAVNRETPDNEAAWKARLELLTALGRNQELAQVLASAKAFLDDGVLKPFMEAGDEKRVEQPVSEDALPSDGPFERLRRRQERIERYLSIFSGRSDVFARQWVDRAAGKQGYVPVRRGLSPQDVEDHLKGGKTYGVYLLKEDNTVAFGAVDADLKNEFRKLPLTGENRRRIHREKVYMVSRMKELAKAAGTETLVEFSGGKGFHFWFFFKPPAPADAVRLFLTGFQETLAGDLSAFSLEVFPKQDRLGGKGLGNLIKLPLGVHRLTGKVSCFPECADRSQGAQLDFLSHVRFLSPDQLKESTSSPGKGPPLIHPRWKAWAETYPELFALERKCPPLGQVIAACRNGMPPAQREERVLLQTIGFLPRAKRLLHYLMGSVPDYNPHLVDFKLSRLRGTPMGCQRIHSLMSFDGDFCEFSRISKYRHPLLHVDGWTDASSVGRAEKVENLSGALENLKAAIDQVLIFVT